MHIAHGALSPIVIERQDADPSLTMAASRFTDRGSGFHMTKAEQALPDSGVDLLIAEVAHFHIDR